MYLKKQFCWHQALCKQKERGQEKYIQKQKRIPVQSEKKNFGWKN